MINDAHLLVSATIEFAKSCAISNDELAGVLGIEADRMKLIARGNTEHAERGVLRRAEQLLLLHQNLAAIFCDDGAVAANWLRTRNIDLDARPLDLLSAQDGIREVNDYLAGYRQKS